MPKTGAVVVVLGLLLAACQGGGPQGEAAIIQEESDSEVSRVEVGLINVNVSGALNFRWEQETDLRIVVLTPGERTVDLFSVGLEDMYIIENDHERFRFAFDLVGGYDGAGRYEIPAHGEEITGIRSTAFLVYSRLVDPETEPLYARENLAEFTQFDKVREACVVEVTKSESEGSLVCPELGDDEGNIIQLRATWRLSRF